MARLGTRGAAVGVALAAVMATAAPVEARPAPPAITVQDLGGPGSGQGLAALSERGHVAFHEGDPGGSGFRAWRWYRGERTPLTPDLPPQWESYTSDVSDDGDVVGYAIGPSGVRGYVWRDGVTTWIPDAPGDTVATDIDDHDRILVNRAPNGSSLGYRASVLAGGREVTSPTVLDGAWLSGTALGDDGQVIGNAYSPATQTAAAFVWHPGRRPVDLGHLGSGSAEAWEVNDAGSIIGFSSTAAGEQRMFIWRHGRMRDLGTLGGAHTRLGLFHGARSDLLNERDQVAGTSETAAGDLHAFLWSGGRMRDLGTLGGATSYGWGINDRGEVVGISQRPSGELAPFLWRDGRMIDLGAATDTADASAVGINDRGQVVGTRYDSQFVAVLWETRPRRPR